MIGREPPPPGQHALDFWEREVACPACDNRDRHSLRLLAAVDVLFCSKCWTRVELAEHKAAIAIEARAANRIGRTPSWPEGRDSAASDSAEPVVQPEAPVP
jgi:DNA-directed RNA polymerase subunit RPC12/RpoP